MKYRSPGRKTAIAPPLLEANKKALRAAKPECFLWSNEKYILSTLQRVEHIEPVPCTIEQVVAYYSGGDGTELAMRKLLRDGGRKKVFYDAVPHH